MTPTDVISTTGTLLLTIGGGAFIGAVVGVGFMLLAGRTADYLVEITLTTLAAYGSFFVAEHYHCSGVIAALAVGNYRPSGSISEAGRHALGSFWEYAAFIANSLIFILIGAQKTFLTTMRSSRSRLPSLPSLCLPKG
jgi:monovalent cation:H+ antiporter, CPA1 family